MWPIKMRDKKDKVVIVWWFKSYALKYIVTVLLLTITPLELARIFISLFPFLLNGRHEIEKQVLGQIRRMNCVILSLTHQAPADRWSLHSHMVSVRTSRKQQRDNKSKRQRYMGPGGSLNSLDLFSYLFHSYTIPQLFNCPTDRLVKTFFFHPLQMNIIRVLHFN